jgi:transcriptional regulator
VEALTNYQEMARPDPWKVSDAPADYIAQHVKGIVPMEIAITRLIGKFKASQHRAEDERQAVTAALADEGVPAEDRDEVIRAPTPRS